MPTRLQRQREKNNLKQAGKYLLLTLITLVLLVKFGLPGLIRLASFWGELKASSQPVDKVNSPAPAAPTLIPLAEATNSARIKIRGYAQAGMTVKLYRNGLAIEDSLVDAEGNFTFQDINLKEGENEFFAEAVDPDGNSSQPSKIDTIIYDSAAPFLIIDRPAANQRFFDKDSPINISGQAETDSQLTINHKFILVDDEGKFTVDWPLESGDNQLDFLARDPAGNETRQTLTVNYTP
jgi:hypothetical protein